MLKLKNRISLLKETTTNEDVVKLSNIAMDSCKSSEPLNNIVAEALVKDLEPFIDDIATKKFIIREKRLIAINNLGVKDLIGKIMESELIHNQSIKYNINSFAQHLDTTSEYFLAKPFMEQFQNISWHKDVKEGFAKINENLKKYEDDIALCSFIHEFNFSAGEYLSKFFMNEFDMYFTERDEYTKKQLLEKIQPYLHDNMLRSLNEFLRSSSNDFQAYSDNVAEVKNIYSPVIVKENSEIFYSSGRFLKKTKNKLSELTEKEIKDLPQSFMMMAEFVNRPNVKVSDNDVTVYTSDKKVKIMKEGANTIIVLNDKQLAPQAFSRFFMNEGIFRPSDNDILANCMNLYENFDNLYEIDYGKRISSKIYENQWVDVFKLDKNVAVSKIDGFNKTNHFYSEMNATQTRNLVLEHIGFDISKSFRDLLPEEQLKVDSYNKDIVEIDESIEFLTNKKNDIVTEINESAILRNDKRINDIISAIDDELVSLKEKKLIIKNILSQFETINIGFKPEDYINEETAVDKFWKDKTNKDKTLFFAQEDEGGKFLVGSQNLENYKDNQYWEIEDTNLSPDAAIKIAKDLADKDPNGIYFETEDVKYFIKESEDKDPDGVDKLNKKEENIEQKRKDEHPSSENELQPGDKIRMKNGKIGIVNVVNDANSEIVINMEDGKTVAVPKQYLSELEIIEKKSKETNPQIKFSDGTQSVQIEEAKDTDWIDGEIDDKGKVKKIKVLALDYTSKGDNENITVKIDNKEQKIKKNLITVNL